MQTSAAPAPVTSVPSAPPGWRWVLWPLGVYGGTRLAGAVILLLAGRDQDPGRTVVSNDYFGLIQNWDGQWFTAIATHGYPTTLPRVDGVVQESEWGFFPLFPATTRVVMEVTRLPFGPAAALLNLVVAGVAMCLLYRLVLVRADRFTALMSVLASCVFPTGVVWQLAYSEALTALMLVSAIWCLYRRRYAWVVVLGLLLAVSRPLAVPLAMVVAVHFLMRWRARSSEAFPVKERWEVAGTALVVGLSAGFWPIVAGVVTGESDAYLQTLAAWKTPAERLAGGWQSWISYAPDDPAAAVVALLGIALIAWFLLGPRRQSWIPELRAWSLCYAAFLLVATIPQSGFMRHLLLLLVPLWPITELNEATLSRRARWAVAAAVCVLGLLAQFFWLRWFWIPGDNWQSIP